eukprot:973587-Pelagomonas_calceolata.AAC.3
MHDTPVRMLAKGVIRGIVPWRRARAFFAQRLRCRLCEETLAAHVVATDPTLTRCVYEHRLNGRRHVRIGKYSVQRLHCWLCEETLAAHVVATNATLVWCTTINVHRFPLCHMVKVEQKREDQDRNCEADQDS